jgi:hypothetical protein
VASPPADPAEDHNTRMNRLALEAWRAANPDAEKILMPHISQMLSSKYLTRSDVEQAGGPVKVTIRGVQPEQFRGQGGMGAETKWVIYFSEAKKGLKLNATNIRTLAAAFGEQSESWVGKVVRLYVDSSVMMAGQVVGGLRIQTPRGAVQGEQYSPPGAFGVPAAHPAGAGAFSSQAAPPRQAGPAFDASTGEIRGGTAPAFSAVAVNAPSVGPGSVAPSTDPDFDDDIPF